jgi:hypothetical protein
MSNTGITPTVGAAALAGVAAVLGLGISPLGAAVKAAGVAPVVAGGAGVGVGAVAWSLGAGAVGAATPAGWRQARLTVSGVLGTGASVIVQGSNDGISWTNLAGLADLVLPQPRAALYSAGVFDGPAAYAPGGGVLVLSNSDLSPFTYLRPTVQGGDGSTAVSITGNLNPGGAV